MKGRRAELMVQLYDLKQELSSGASRKQAGATVVW
jgi:hypothetical protein